MGDLAEGVVVVHRGPQPFRQLVLQAPVVEALVQKNHGAEVVAVADHAAERLIHGADSGLLVPADTTAEHDATRVKGRTQMELVGGDGGGKGDLQPTFYSAPEQARSGALPETRRDERAVASTKKRSCRWEVRRERAYQALPLMARPLFPTLALSSSSTWRLMIT